MALRKEIDTLLTTKMDRKDFLRSVAIGLVAITGLSTIIRMVAPTRTNKQAVSAAPQGYGSSVYGGKKTS